MELVYFISLTFILVIVAIALHVGFGAYISSKIMVRDENGEIPWLNKRNMLIVFVLVLMFTAHLIQNGIIGGI